MATGTPIEQTFFGGCPHDCPDTCAMLYKVKDGRLIEVRGNPEHPFTHGGLCVKLKDYDDHHYNADRILYPLKRNGPKGSRQYVRIPWDEALTTINRRWTEIIGKYGAEAILPYNYLGNEGLLQGLTVGDAFFNKLGATVCEKTFCGSGSATAWLLTVGPTGGVDPESFIHSRYIVLWACNSVSTNLHHWRIIKQAQKRGAKVVVIDAFRSRTAKEADWHIAPGPGTDGALAMALMSVLIKDDLLDHDYIEKYTVGFEELKEPRVHAGECRDDHWRGGGRHPHARARVLPHAAFGDPPRCSTGAIGRWRPDHTCGLLYSGAYGVMAPRRRRALADAVLGVSHALGSHVPSRVDQARHARRKRAATWRRAHREDAARPADHVAYGLQRQPDVAGARDRHHR